MHQMAYKSTVHVIKTCYCAIEKPSLFCYNKTILLLQQKRPKKSQKLMDFDPGYLKTQDNFYTTVSPV